MKYSVSGDIYQVVALELTLKIPEEWICKTCGSKESRDARPLSGASRPFLGLQRGDFETWALILMPSTFSLLVRLVIDSRSLHIAKIFLNMFNRASDFSPSCHFTPHRKSS
jgi:hypothetical protein